MVHGGRGPRAFPPANGGAQALRLTTGTADPLLPLIAQGVDGADNVDLAVAFAMDSGVQLIAPWFRDLLDRGGRLRVVVGDYMNVTESAALHRLADLDGAQVRVFETGSGSFHPKAWLFRAAERQGAAIVGSSNLSRTALTTGVEWNLHAEGAAARGAAPKAKKSRRALAVGLQRKGAIKQETFQVEAMTAIQIVSGVRRPLQGC